MTLLDTDRYVNTVAPIAANPAVQKAVADKLDTAITPASTSPALAQQVLPDRADVLAPAIQRGVQGVISDRIDEFTRSPRFQELWIEANRRAHTRLVDLLTERPLEAPRARRRHGLPRPLAGRRPRQDRAHAERGLARIADAIPPTVDGQIKLVQSSALVRTRGRS